MKTKIYLDACIFAAYVCEKHLNHKVVVDGIKALENLDAEIYSSEWALSEMIKVLVKDYDFQKSRAEKLAGEFRKKSFIGSVEVNWVEIDSSYNFNDFFDYLKNLLIDSKKLPIADAIHCLMMENNGIEYILTTDSDFEALNNVTSISPKVLGAMVLKN